MKNYTKQFFKSWMLFFVKVTVHLYNAGNHWLVIVILKQFGNLGQLCIMRNQLKLIVSKEINIKCMQCLFALIRQTVSGRKPVGIDVLWVSLWIILKVFKMFETKQATPSLWEGALTFRIRKLNIIGRWHFYTLFDWKIPLESTQIQNPMSI